MFDTIIIGAGPTGLTAAIYTARRMMKTLIISKNIGGQTVWASEIMNYPAIESIKGPELINKMLGQVKNFGVELKSDEVNKITKQDDGNYVVHTDNDKFKAKTVIIAMGLSPKCLKLPNEKELTGKGISYCATCDGPFFKNKIVAVVGGGNAALDAALVMSAIAKQVYLIYRKTQFKGFEIMVEKVKKIANIKIMLENEVCGLVGTKKLEKIQITNLVNKEITELKVDGLFIEIGHEPKTNAAAELVERDSKGQILVDLSCQTSQAGIFAAGDVTQGEFKQIIIGCGQGAIAALSAYKYLHTKE
jgi:NADH-dependent peroxiredoxin subunit F